MRKDTEFQISQKMKQLREDLKQEAALAAVASAEAILREKVMASDQARLADEYVTQLESTESATRAEARP